MAVYVMSDIHGLKDKFFSALQEISFNDEDHLYILGDVIDRGMDGIPLLRQISHDKRMTLLLGNHELLMYDYLIKRGEEEKSLWYLNGGGPTHLDYEKLSDLQKEELMDYLYHLPVSIPDVDVNGKHFSLVHSAWCFLDKEDVSYFNGDKDKYFNVVWFRSESISKIYYIEAPKDHIVIGGHTPTYYFGSLDNHIKGNKTELKDCDYLDIDCGCAFGEEGKLGVLRLDDYKEWYF